MKDATAKKVTAFNVVGIDPSRYWMDGYGYWTEDGKVYEDAVLVTLTKEDAFWVSVTCGQLCFLHVDMETQNPNGYLLEEAEAVLKDLFERGDVTGYTVITNPSRLEGIPECFSVLSKEEAEKLGVIRWRLRPVYYEFVFV